MGALSCVQRQTDSPGPPAMQKAEFLQRRSKLCAAGGIGHQPTFHWGQGPHSRWDGVGHQATFNTGAKSTQEMGLDTRLCPVQPRGRLKVPPGTQLELLG